MKLIFTLAIVSLTLIDLNHHFKTTNNYICQKRPTLCSLNEEQNKIYCEQTKCIGNKNYECSNYYCTINKETCQELLRMSSMVRSMSFMHISHIKRYRDFMSNITTCPKVQIEFDTSSLCYHDSKCIKSEVLTTGVGYIYYNHTIDCPCRGEYSHECSPNICARNQSECDNLGFLRSHKNVKNLVTNLKIKPCSTYYRSFKRFF